MGMLDTAAPASVAVNGPEDEVLDWDAVVWRVVEDDVRRLRQRIFTATQAGDLKKVRNLQKLMLRSRANALASVRRVTEINAGRKTAGVDGRLVVDDQDKAEMAAWLQHGAAAWTPRPVKRVFIPKAGGKRRGLGIPVIADRCLQAQVSAALEPEWEARFESRSYGFRPGRSCQDAMQSIFVTARGTTCKRQWVLDADVAACLDVCSYCFLPDCHGWNRACWGVGGSMRSPFRRPVRRCTARRSPRAIRSMIALRDSPCARVASSIASHPWGASSTNSARTWSVRRIRHGAPGVSCSPVTKPSVTQRCRGGGGRWSCAAASAMVSG